MEFIIEGDTSKMQENFTRALCEIVIENLREGKMFEPKKTNSSGENNRK